MRPIRIDLSPPFEVKFESNEQYDLCEVRLFKQGSVTPLLILQACFKDNILMLDISRKLELIGVGG